MPIATMNAAIADQELQRTVGRNHAHTPAGPAIAACASRRAQPSAARHACSELAGIAGYPRQHALDHRRRCPGNGSAASRNAPTATSFAALSTAGAVPPASAARCAPGAGRETLEVRRFEIEPGGAQNVERFYTGARSAPASRAHAQSAYACRDCPVAPASSRRRTRPANARCSAGARRHRPGAAAGRTAGRPRSAPGPCSSASPNRPRSCGPSPSADARTPDRASRSASPLAGVRRNGPPDAVSSTRRTPARDLPPMH